MKPQPLYTTGDGRVRVYADKRQERWYLRFAGIITELPDGVTFGQATLIADELAGLTEDRTRPFRVYGLRKKDG